MVGMRTFHNVSLSSGLVSDIGSPPQLEVYCRLMSAGLHSDAASAWINALEREEVLDRIMWIVANTMNPQLREKVRLIVMFTLFMVCSPNTF